MLQIYISRHGQDSDNIKGILNGHRDQPLTEIGVRQAQSLAEYIKETGIIFNKIYSSPLKRANKTAQIINEKVNGPGVEIYQELIERNFGIMTGMPTSSIVEKCSPDIIKTDTITYFLSPKGSETFPELVKRGKKIIDYIKSTNIEGNILLVTHGDIGKMVYCAYYDLDWQDVLKNFHFGNSEMIMLSPQVPPKHSYIFKQSQYNL